MTDVTIMHGVISWTQHRMYSYYSYVKLCNKESKMTIQQTAQEDEHCIGCGDFDVPLQDELCERCCNEAVYKEIQQKHQRDSDIKATLKYCEEQGLK